MFYYHYMYKLNDKHTEYIDKTEYVERMDYGKQTQRPCMILPTFLFM